MSEKIVLDILGDQDEKTLYRDISYDDGDNVLNKNANQSSVNIVELDEKPAFRNHDIETEQSLVNNKINRDNGCTDNTVVLNPVLLRAVSAQEFIPTKFVALEEKESDIRREHSVVEHQSLTVNEEEDVTLGVLKYVIMALTDNPGDFEQTIEHLTDHLKHFVTRQETLEAVVDTIITQVQKNVFDTRL